MKNLIFIFAFILTWRAEWTVLKYCPGEFDEIRGETRGDQHCVKTVFSWRHKQFETMGDLVYFENNKLYASSGTVISNVSYSEVKDK